MKDKKEKVAERKLKWARNNKEKVKERNRKWAENNKEKAAESMRKWRKNNKEKVAEDKRMWSKNNKGKRTENASFLRQFGTSKVLLPIKKQAALAHLGKRISDNRAKNIDPSKINSIIKLINEGNTHVAYQ